MRSGAISFALAAILLLSGCGRQSMLKPGAPASGEIAHLEWFVFILFLVITGVMWLLVALVVTRPRGSFEEHETVDAGGGHSFVLIGGFAIPAIILAVVFIVGVKAMADFPVHDGHMHSPDIVITGQQWWWTVQYVRGSVDQYVTTANEIHIPAGRPVDIDLKSTDVIHSFWVRRSTEKWI